MVGSLMARALLRVLLIECVLQRSSVSPIEVPMRYRTLIFDLDGSGLSAT